jgi:hypothetical protein
MAFRKGQSGNPGKQFQKGQSGNPGGRPKWKPITEALLELLAQDLKKYKKFRAKTPAQKIAKRMIDDAVKGVTTLVREVLDRTEGKVPLPISTDTGPIDVNVRIHHIGAQPRHRAAAPTD